MPYLFDHLATVQALLTHSPCGLITDVDGTISEIAPSPSEAQVSPLCRKGLSTLTRRLALVAAISGREVGEVRRMVGIEEMVYIGNHGLETWANGVVRLEEGVQGYLSKVAQAVDELRDLVTAQGVILKHKGAALAIHYRRCPDREAARDEILSALEKSPVARQLQVMEGRMVVELRPPLGLNKGSAVLTLAERHRLQGAIYMGDDITDVDAFIAVRGMPHGIAIAVLSDETPPVVENEADLSLGGVTDVERFLIWLVEATDMPAS